MKAMNRCELHPRRGAMAWGSFVGFVCKECFKKTHDSNDGWDSIMEHQALVAQRYNKK